MIGLKLLGAEVVVSRLAAAGTAVGKTRRSDLLRAALMVQRELRERVSRPGGWDPFWGRQSQPGAAMSGRTGKTRQRITVGPVLTHGAVESVAVGSPDPHMRLQESGGTVQGRPYLRIPTAAAQTAAGVDRNAGRSIRGLPGFVVIRSRAGKLWVIRREGQRIEWMYLLVRSARQRARGIFRATKGKVEPMIEALFAGSISQIVRRANG